MMSDEKIEVGRRVFYWCLNDDKYTGCEFKKIDASNWLEITKVPDPKPEIPDEPMTRGDVVTIEGDDEFIAVRFTGADDLPYPFVGASSVTGNEDLFNWSEIVSRAAGRKIIVHKTVDPDEAPVKVDTYAEWCTLPEGELKKYKWRDDEGDLWWYSSSHDAFLPEGEQSDFAFDIKHYFPLIRDEKID